MAIPLHMRDKMSKDPLYKQCFRVALGECDCDGRVEYEHCFTYAGKQVNEIWAIIPCCTYHHRDKGLNKELNRLFALMRATDADFAKYHKKNWWGDFEYLKGKYKEEVKLFQKHLDDKMIK